MKKQTLVILAIIAVITTLLTVSALSNEVGYKLSPCDAIDISLENATVTDFLNATNMTTVQVYNFKGYKGENTWMVQWSSSNRLLDVYVNVATGYIEGIEKITVPEALKAWVVANYGDGTRVTSDSADKLIDAMMMGTLAPLPAGYTSADITQDVWKWALNNVGWKPSTTTPPVTPTGPPDAIKAWIVANYGDGTRVTSEGWLKLYDANMMNNLAPLPAGYTKASITEEVVLWAKSNPNYTVSGTTPTPTPTVEVPETICGWINSIGVTNLTEDHGLYVYDLAVGWTTVADSIYDTLSPKPSRLPAALATEDNGRAVYYYAIGWNTIANEITGCNFWTTPTPTPTQRVIDTVEIGVEIVGSTPTPTPTPETKTWHSVATFRGRNPKQTPVFTIKGDMWRMNWEAVSREEDSRIYVSVYKETLLMTWLTYFSQDTFFVDAGTHCVYDGPGVYDLRVKPTSLEYWQIEVEDYY
jgi:hypothetical protein